MSHRALAKAPRLRVLHVWNTCGVGSLIARLSNQESRVITRKINGNQDIPDYHDAIVVSAPAAIFKLLILLQLKLFKPHVVHVHTLVDYLSFIRKNVDSFIIYHAHGSEVRNKKLEIDADLVLVSTPDLLEFIPEAIYCPNPVDPAFHPGKTTKNSALFIRNKCCDRLKMAKDYAKLKNLTLHVIDLIKNRGVPYSAMPEIIRKHEFFLEFKGFPYPVMSKTALEALASGVTVVHEDNFRLIKPESFDFEKNNQKIIKIYRRISECLLNS